MSATARNRSAQNAARFRVDPGRATDDDDRHRALLRQLRDLDDDLAVGKLTEADHARLSAPVIREAAAASRQRRARRPEPEPAARKIRPGRSRRARTIATVLITAAAATGIAVVLVGAVTPRGTGQPASGGAAPAAAAAPSTTASTTPSPTGAAQPALTAQQAAAIATAVVAVKEHPKDLAAHLALARAYADGGVTQLAAVEYLAITRIDPANAEANTALGLLAFEVGQTAQGKKLVDTALSAHPNYPEARYVRALILLMGLHQPKPAIRDLHAYLALAPFGAHRTAAQTLLVLADSESHR